MNLLKKNIIEALPPIYATESIPIEDKLVICKFFLPGTSWSWYVFEGEFDKETNDYVFFGIVHGFEKEMGYFTLSDISKLSNTMGTKVERDESVFKISYKEVKAT